MYVRPLQYDVFHKRFHRSGKGEGAIMPSEYVARYAAGGVAQKQLFKLYVEANGDWAQAQVIEEQENEKAMPHINKVIL